jgi:hypothetical protein
MKPWLFLFPAIVLCSASAEEIVLHRIHSVNGEGSVIYRVEREEIEKVPKWEPKVGSKPPLSRDQAVEIAKRTVSASDVGEKAEMAVTLETTNRFEEDIVKKLPEKGCRWFYVVELKEKEKKPVFVLVTMSGVGVTPVIGKQ